MRGLAATVAVWALACVGAASASAAQLAFVGNELSHSVSVVDTATNKVVGTIGVDGGPASIAITPDGRYAYVAGGTGKTVSVIDTSTGKPAGEPIEVGTTPFGLAITPDGSHVYVADRGSNEFSVIDTATRTVVSKPVGAAMSSEPAGIAVTPDGRFAYVTVAAEGTVRVIDTETNEFLAGEPIVVGAGPEGIEFSPDGKTAYVADRGGDEVSAIDTATRQVTPIPLGGGDGPRGIVVAPDGKRAFVVDLNSDSVSVIDTTTNQAIEEVKVREQPQEVAISADGKTVYVTVAGGPPGERTAEVERIDVKTGAVVGSPIELPGEFAAGIALTPDQSPTAAFAVPDLTARVPATFSGAASTDPDGSVASWDWTFGDGGTARGARPTHTYGASGSYDVKLSVVDDQGCGEEEVFTGRTAYCSGGASSVVHPVTVKPPPAESAAPPANDFRIRRIVHNRRNGTVRMKVWLPSAGSVVLFGPKVHAVTRKSRAGQSMWLTIHARVELNKRLKKIHRARVRIRVTFTPNGGAAKTMHRSVALLRASRHGHHRH